MTVVTDGIYILFHFIILCFYINSRKASLLLRAPPGFALFYSSKSVIEGEGEDDFSFCGIVMKWGNRNTRIKGLKNKIHKIFV